MMMQPSIKPADEGSAGDIIARIGSLTRMLRDSLRELGLDGRLPKRRRRSLMRATVWITSSR